MQNPHEAFIALGSNLGVRSEMIRQALQLLREAGLELVRVSSLIETEPEGGPSDQRRFLNGVAHFRTSLSPRELLGVLLEVERKLGRERKPGERNGPRTLDLDLLLYDQEILEEDGLRIPHPRMHQRRFVLAPLAEIAPLARHPVLNHTALELLALHEAPK